VDHHAEGSREVLLVRDAQRQACMLTWAHRRDRNYKLAVQVPDGGQVLEVVASDLFLALQLLRRQLEPSGWQVAVQGSCRNAWASGMQRDIAGARRVYICQLGREVIPREAVDIFGPADLDDLATVDQQLAFHEEWKASRRPGIPG
jgi:hypothetical protein